MKFGYTKERPETEEWRDIPGFEGLYQISSMGRVKSLSRKVWNGYSFFKMKEKVLKPNIITKGYAQVYLRSGGGRRRTCLLVHRFNSVAETARFFGEKNRSNLIKALKGEQHTYHGYIVRYAD